MTQEVLDFIKSYKKENKVEPSESQIAQHFKRTRSFSRVHLKKLEEQGYITRTEYVPKTTYELK